MTLSDFSSALSALSRSVCVSAVLLLGACASAPEAPEPVAEEGEYWSYSRVIDTDRSMITLFDPLDLEHHAADPADWYEYDFAFLDDLASGRFAAVLLQTKGLHTVRVTNAPLSDKELAVAGPDAELRLRVLHDRLLLSGGTAWPSEERSVAAALRSAAETQDWLHVPSGDYKVTATVLDTRKSEVHDVVFQLEEIDTIDKVAHAPGIPHLVPDAAVAGVAGVNAPGISFAERCSAVSRHAELSPLLDSTLPLPGAYGDIEVSEALSVRGRISQAAGDSADMPLVVARDTTVGTVGMYIQPDRWLQQGRDRWGRVSYSMRGRVLCAVRIVNVEPGQAGFMLTVDPEPTAQDPLPQSLAQELTRRFDIWLRLTGDPAARFKSEYVRRARDYRSLVQGVMQYMDLPARTVESLVLLSNQERAEQLIELMSSNGI